MMISVHAKFQDTVEKIYQLKQEHVFRFWDELGDSSHSALLNQIAGIDFDLLQYLYNKATQKNGIDNQGVLEPAPSIPIPKTTDQKKAAEKAKILGERAIASGKVAVFLVAGGQGSRLGFDGPKGCFPVGPVTGKTLFEMQAEKIRAASIAYQTVIPWYIMTSETNNEDTRNFFQKNHFFGLSSEDVIFFKQRMIPALDEKGKLILDGKDHIFVSPNGHGGSLLAIYESGALKHMKNRGIEILSYYQVDNVLIRIVDPVFIGYHLQANAEMSSKMLIKRHPSEKVGVFGKVDGKLKVIEYSDMSDEDMTAANPDGSLVYGAGSIAIHLISTQFIEEEVQDGFKLPYHVAYKKIPYVDNEGRIVQPNKPNGYKFETFVFDALSDTRNSIIMEVKREEEFSPVKNAAGEDSPETAKQDLCNLFGSWLEKAGYDIPKNSRGDFQVRIEISPLYACDEASFLKKMPKGISLKFPLSIDFDWNEVCHV